MFCFFSLLPRLSNPSQGVIEFLLGYPNCIKKVKKKSEFLCDDKQRNGCKRTGEGDDKVKCDKPEAKDRRISQNYQIRRTPEFNKILHEAFHVI